MSIYKIIKISILLGTGIIVACSADKTETKSQVSVKAQESSNTSSLHIDALSVSINTDTGEFIDSPSTKIVNANSLNGNPQQPTEPVNNYSELKPSTVPGGGSYIELTIPPK